MAEKRAKGIGRGRPGCLWPIRDHDDPQGKKKEEGMRRTIRHSLVAPALAVLVAVAAWAPSAAAQGVDAAQLERLQRIIEQQQTQIEAQARLLRSLQGQVDALARAAAQAT
ncbi:MAG: hypothetical protein V3S87_09795, partial [Alphaproteobacteria bacterium]